MPKDDRLDKMAHRLTVVNTPLVFTDQKELLSLALEWKMAAIQLHRDRVELDEEVQHFRDGLNAVADWFADDVPAAAAVDERQHDRFCGVPNGWRCESGTCACWCHGRRAGVRKW